jgi:uncharacterized protein YodC (DUF2158 family)
VYYASAVSRPAVLRRGAKLYYGFTVRTSEKGHDMLLKDVEIGGSYEVRWHDGSLTVVRITGLHGYPVRGGYPYGVIGRKTRLSAVNLTTGRRVEIKSAAKLRRKVG